MIGTLLRAFSFLVSLTLSVLVLFFLYKATAFFEAESIHQKTMSMSDSQEMNWKERAGIKSVWIPFIATLAIGLYAHGAMMVLWLPLKKKTSS